MENTIKFESSENVEKSIKREKVFAVFRKILVYAFLIVVAITILFPFYWMILTSLKSNYEYTHTLVPTFYVTMGIQWENYYDALQVNYFFENLFNTLLVAVVSTTLSMVIIILAAFAFARLNFKGKNLVFTILLATMMVPGELFTITNYATISANIPGFKDTWINTYTALILPFLVSIFYIYLLRNNFMQIPDSLYYAAKVDGTSDIKYLFKVMIPLTRPTLISILILKIMGSWNAYIWPRLVNRKEMRLISNWLTLGFTGDDGLTNYPMKMAGVVIVSTPLLILFIIFRKYIMRGVSRSGTKG